MSCTRYKLGRSDLTYDWPSQQNPAHGGHSWQVSGEWRARGVDSSGDAHEGRGFARIGVAFRGGEDGMLGYRFNIHAFGPGPVGQYGEEGDPIYAVGATEQFAAEAPQGPNTMVLTGRRYTADDSGAQRVTASWQLTRAPDDDGDGVPDDVDPQVDAPDAWPAKDLCEPHQHYEFQREWDTYNADRSCKVRTTSPRYNAYFTGRDDPILSYGADITWCFNGLRTGVRAVSRPSAVSDLGADSLLGRLERTLRKVFVFDFEWQPADGPHYGAFAMPGGVRDVEVSSGSFAICPEISIGGLAKALKYLKVFGGKALPSGAKAWKAFVKKFGAPLLRLALKTPLAKVLTEIRTRAYSAFYLKHRKTKSKSAAEASAKKDLKRFNKHLGMLVEETIQYAAKRAKFPKITPCFDVWKPKVVTTIYPHGQERTTEEGERPNIWDTVLDVREAPGPGG